MRNDRLVWNIFTTIKWGFMIGIFLVAIKTLFLLAMTGIQKYIIDDVFLSQKFDLIWVYLAFFLTSLLLYNGFHIVGEVMLNIQSRKANAYLLNKYMKVISGIPVKKFQSEPSGRYTNYYFQEINTITSIFASYGIIPGIVQKVVSLIVLSIVVGYASPIILLGIFVIGIVFIPLGKIFAPKIKKVSKEIQEDRAKLNTHLVESISSSREVIAFNRLGWENERLTKVFNTIFRLSMKEVQIGNKQLLISDSLRYGTSFLVLAYGGYEVINQNLSLGLFVVAYQFSGQLMTSFNELYVSIMQWPTVRASLERLEVIMEYETEYTDGLEFSDVIKSIKFRNVDFRYSDDSPKVIDQLTLDMSGNQKIALVGLSGSGKSTITQLLVRSYKPDTGQILINDVPFNEVGQEYWISRIAVVFQEPFLFPESIRTNLTLGRNVSDDEMIAMCQNVCIHEDIMELPFGYDTVLGERGITLSGGQRQRLALARALLKKPELLILDEATSALDLDTERTIVRNLDRIRSGQMTVIIAHRLSTVMNADKIYVLDNGRITGVGTHEELIATNDRYIELSLHQHFREIKGLSKA